MNSSAVVRIFLKDLRRVWPLAACAVGLMALSISLVLCPYSVFMANVNSIDAPSALRWFIVVFVALTATLDDPVPGDSGSWVSRPISAAQLLMAKLALCLVTLALPAGLVVILGGLACHGQPGVVCGAAALMGGLTFLVALGAAVLGALTGSLRRAVFVAVVLGVGGSLLSVHLDALAYLLTPKSAIFGDFLDNGVLPKTGFFVPELISGVAAAVMVLVYQYQQRRTGRSALMTLVLGSFVWLIAQGWPYLKLQSVWHPGWAPDSASAPVQFALRNSEGDLQQMDPQPFPLVDQVEIGFQARQEGSAGGEAARLVRGQSRFTADDGRKYVMPRPDHFTSWSSGPDEPDDNVPHDVFEAMGGLPAHKPAYNLTVNLLRMPQSSYAALRGTHGTLESWVQFVSSHPRLVGRMPLNLSAELTLADESYRMHSIFVLPRGRVDVSVELVALSAHSPFYLPFCRLALVNAERNELAPMIGWLISPYPRSILIMRSRVFGNSFRDTWSLSTHRKVGVLDENWLRNAELLILDEKETLGPEVYYNWGEVTLPTAAARH